MFIQKQLYLCFTLIFLFSQTAFAESKGNFPELAQINSTVTTMSFSPNQKYIAFGTKKGTVSIIHIETAKIVELGQHDAKVNEIAWTPDSKNVVSCSDDTTVRLWNVKDKTERIMREHEGAVYCVSVHPKGKWIASGGSDNRVILWEPKNNEIKVMSKHTDAVWSLSFSPKGKFLASGGGEGDNRVILWKYTANRTLVAFQFKKGINVVRFFPDAKTIVAGAMDSSIKVWSILDKKTQRSFHNLKKPIRQMEFISNKEALFIMQYDKVIYSITKNKKKFKLLEKYKHDSNIVSFTVHQRGQLVSFSDDKNRIYIMGDKLFKKKTNKKKTTDKMSLSIKKQDFSIEFLSQKSYDKPQNKTTLKIKVIGKNYIRKMVIISINRYNQSFTLIPNRDVKSVEFQNEIHLVKGENPIFILILDDKGMRSKRSVIYNGHN